MTYRLLLSVALLFLVDAPSPADAAPSPKPDLVLQAQVTKIFISRRPRSRHNWVVQTRVLQVKKGRYKAKRFDFRVHSPSRSNLRVGKVITIEAYRVPGGYRVPFKRY